MGYTKISPNQQHLPLSTPQAHSVTYQNPFEAAGVFVLPVTKPMSVSRIQQERSDVYEGLRSTSDFCVINGRPYVVVRISSMSVAWHNHVPRRSISSHRARGLLIPVATSMLLRNSIFEGWRFSTERLRQLTKPLLECQSCRWCSHAVV